ncbi:zona pellucida-like domain protein [Ancylostoma caninum]|uniref:Zona pellucida-like domain protein n=1 Tax=Ancylostoma caninum TaxID=29170 RepID=A0A368H562_ANCCA|nr:zona pellucida-like domain protein [Ancylostoma caninum]
MKSSAFAYILLLVLRALPIPVDNGVDGDPEIECGPTTIAINFSTRKQFEGHVYVKPRFITKVDRAFRISCFYMEASKDVGSQIDVSEMTTTSVTHLVQMPVCRYDILEGGPNGIPVEFGKIGQQVYHRWSCASETVNTFCMLVHSCSVDDGKGDRVAILDSDGCAMDRYLLNNLEYPEDLLAGQEAHVYKYADRDSLYFQCQISIQVKEKGVSCDTCYHF